MRIRLSQLRRIIKEEASRALTESEVSEETLIEKLKADLCSHIESGLKAHGEKSVSLWANDTDYTCKFNENEGTFSITSDSSGEPIAVFSIVKK